MRVLSYRYPGRQERNIIINKKDLKQTCTGTALNTMLHGRTLSRKSYSHDLAQCQTIEVSCTWSARQLRDVSLFSGGGALFWGEVIIFFPLVWGRVTIFFKVLGEDHNFLKVFLLRK